jgi:SAM-dependent methyltransferase
MDIQASRKPQFGNWASIQKVRHTVFASILFALPAALLLVFEPALGSWAIIPAALLLAASVLMLAFALVIMRARRQLSWEGGGVQKKVLGLLLDQVQWYGRGRALDIGCGSGALIIALARCYAEAGLDGIDYWGGSWGYGKKQCEENAALEGVPGRIAFTQASASKLPFPDGTFDLAVSNLVFHEVAPARDKRDVVREALRVVKPGGQFVFQDLFRLYCRPEELVELMKNWGVREAHYEDTSKAAFITGVLKLPFMLGTLGMIYGVK